MNVTVRAKVIKDNTGTAIKLPVILTEVGPLEPLTDYLLEKYHAKSGSWILKLVQAVSLLLDYMVANHDCFNEPKELFTTFTQRLYSGTIGEDGLDPSGLYWYPRDSKLVAHLTSLLADFSDWMTEHRGAMPLNPWRNATNYEEMLNWAAYHQKHNRAFLGHTWDKGKASETAKRARYTLLKRSPIIEGDGVKFFPDDLIWDLMFKGFIVPGMQNSPRIEERLNLRDILITLLQHFGSTRKCEPFHLYVQDVLPDPNDAESAWVRIFHPSEGIAPPDWLDAKSKKTDCNRGAYLRGKYQMLPRNEYYENDYLHAGWKHPLLENKLKFFHVHWFPTWTGKVFKKFWDLYMIQRALMDCPHPFAFVATSGRPYSICDYNEAHVRAVERIGLVSAKMNGTTPHGHRHAYGQRMTDAKLDPKIQKKAFHHQSIESQEIYTAQTIGKVTNVMESASRTLERGELLEPSDLTHWMEEYKGHRSF